MNVVILIFGHLSMNSIWEKFKSISEQIKDNDEVLIDDSFLIGQFLILWHIKNPFVVLTDKNQLTIIQSSVFGLG